MVINLIMKKIDIKALKDYLNSNDNNVFKEDAFDNIGILTNLVNKANIGGDIGELNLKDGFLGGKYKFKAAILWDSSEKSMSIKENEYENAIMNINHTLIF